MTYLSASSGPKRFVVWTIIACTAGFGSALFLSAPFVGATPPPSEGTARIVEREQAERRQLGGGRAEIRLLAQGSRAFIGELTLAAGAQVPQHRDEDEEYLHILSGSGKITIDGVEHTLRAGATVYMPARAEVSFVNGDQPLRALQVFAGPESAAKYQRWTPVEGAP